MVYDEMVIFFIRDMKIIQYQPKNTLFLGFCEGVDSPTFLRHNKQDHEDSLNTISIIMARKNRSLSRKRRSTGDGIEKNPAAWSFDKGVAKVFDEHAKKSIPGYLEGHDIICKASDFFVHEGSRVVDIGCSTGQLLGKLYDRHKAKHLELAGIDTEEEMIEKAKSNNKKRTISFSRENALEFDYTNADLVISYYTLQFIQPRVRQDLLKRIWEGMNWGGGFFLFEKVRGSDARFHDINTSLYWEFKEEQGFGDEEIMGKWRSLRGVLEPFTQAGNMGLLERAGWVDIETIFKWGPFQGFLAIK